VFLFFSNGCGCIGSLLVSVVLSLIVAMVFGWL
jgi:hypothetical protein